ncbi:hypothetical protein BD779DRAFT_441142 [Infundibulicybe gibba]|nr:hypothetical protein BD779DRAFT_441142 [Infundibulicybe gibba]
MLPRVFYLHHGLDELYYCLQANESFTDPLIHDSHGPVPHYQKFLETLYSRLLQDPLASYAVPIIYAMFTDLTPLTIAQLLGLIPGELYGSAAMQGLFGADFWEKQEWIRISKSLGVLLKIGRVKLRPSQENKDGHIDERMRDAHEYLAISCARHLSSRTDPEGNTDWDSPSWYARQYWSDHLGRAKPSGRLFEILRCVNINGRDIEPVIRWLEESPSTPGDILARWHAARVDHSAECTWREKASCHLDRAVESRRSVRLGLGSKCMTKKKEAPSNKASRTESISKNLA